MKKNNGIITIIIILAVILLAILIIARPKTTPEEEVSKCIGAKSTLYVQLGCRACETQENMFGENVQYLTIIDCFYEKEKCLEITHTPTWIIDGKSYEGVQSIEKLKELTGC